MLVATLVSFIVLTFPIFINGKGLYIHENKKFYYVIKIFGVLRVLSGYITVKNNFFLIKYGKRKTYFSPLNNVLGLRKKIKPFLDLHLIRLKSLTEVGSKDNLISSFTYAFVFQYFNYYLCDVLNKTKPYLKINNDVNVIENSSIFNIYIKLSIVLNVITILVNFIKILTEKIFYARKA